MMKALPDSISALVLDFDGVFTDNDVFVFQNGQEAVKCNRSDGLRLFYIKQVNIPILVLSSQENPIVSSRCRKLGLEEVLQVDVNDKYSALTKWIRKKKLNIKKVIYIGNDINDLSCMKGVGCSVAVKDAYPEIKKVADIVLSKCGGDGAICEICDLILKKLGVKYVS